MIKKAFKQHDMQEHMGGKGTKLKLKKGGMMNCATGGAIPSESTRGMPATTIVNTAKPDNSPAKTGGVRNGNAGGFKKGGMMKCATGGAIASEKTSGSYDTTQMHTAKPDNSPANTGEVKKGNAGGFKAGGMMGGGMMGGYKDGGMAMVEKDGKMVPDFAADGKGKMKKGGMMGGGMSGYATGGVAKSNAGGYRKGGAAKKFAEGGRVQNDGGPEQMPQGRKPMSQPVAIDMLSGTYKKGGRVAPNNAKLQAINNAEFAPTMKAAKKDSNEKYGPARDFMKKAGGAC
jgi:hypothetical protein